MAGTANVFSGTEQTFGGISSVQQQQCQSGEELAEWRSLEQVENGSPSTSPPYWDSDNDFDGELKPSELYGKYTWKIDKFSQINKRELKSNAFEVGGYKWYILIYPQGCDVCNHLSLFLCVANYDKLLPGWSHFAQFTIAVVNKDPKKSKYSDTLHRFWKKEHDWGWKKFMELSKVLDGFIDADTLVIKAQVQVIRERADRPFRCLDCQYRRELVRVYLTNVEQICRRFVEERRGKLGKLIEDKARWSSFRGFWLGLDQSCRRRMSQEKMELIMKVLVKHFFIEKEVTSTLVMDSLYSGLKAIEGQSKGKRIKGKHLEAEDLQVPIICIEKDTLTLVDDVLLLFERAAIEPLPPKDDKGPQNRTKDGNAGEELNKDLIERDERRLTELGRRTIEIFVLAHIFSKIEISYQEAVALRKQEELIREEEAAWLAESEQKAKRGAVDKEKKSKKKQSKQKQNNRRGKDKGREKTGSNDLDKTELNHHIAESKGAVTEPESVLQKSESVEAGSESDFVDLVPEILPPYPEDKDVSSANCDTDTSEVQPPTEVSNSGVNGHFGVKNGVEGRSSSLVDDSSSTCSSDSVPPVASGGRRKGTSHHHKDQKYPSRRRDHQPRSNSNTADWTDGEVSRPSEPGLCARQQDDPFQNSNPEGSPIPAVTLSLQARAVNQKERQTLEKEDEPGFLVKNLRSKDSVDEKASEGRTAALAMSPRMCSSKSVKLMVNAASNPVTIKKSSPDFSEHANGSVFLAEAELTTTLKLGPQKLPPLKTADKPSGHPVVPGCQKLTAHEVPATTDKPSALPMPVISRPMSAPLANNPRPAVSTVSTASTAQSPTVLASAASRLGPEPTTSSAQGHTPRCYRNAIIGGHPTGSFYAFSQNHSASSMVDPSQSYSQAPTLMPEPLFSPHSSDRKGSNHIMSNVSFGMVRNRHDLPNQTTWAGRPGMDESRNLSVDQGIMINGMQTLNLHNPGHSRSESIFSSEFPAGSSGHQSRTMVDEFPHLDIINDLLDDEVGISSALSGYPSLSNRSHSLNRQYSFPGEASISHGPALSVSSCRYDRNHVYHDNGFQHGYGASGRSHDTLKDVITQISPRAYINGQVDGFMPNQWRTSGSDALHLSARNMDNNGYHPNHRPECPTPGAGINSYAVFRPSNGQ